MHIGVFRETWWYTYKALSFVPRGTRVRKLVIKPCSGVESLQVMGNRKAAMETVIWTRIALPN